MPYTSDVAYTIRFIEQTSNDSMILDYNEVKRCKESFYTFLAEAKSKAETRGCFDPTNRHNIQDRHNQGFYLNEEKMTINFLVYGVKWHTGYQDVKCHEALVDLAQEWSNDNDYIGGVFSRIGESPEDVEDFTFGCGEGDWQSVNRYLVCDWVENNR